MYIYVRYVRCRWRAKREREVRGGDDRGVDQPVFDRVLKYVINDRDLSSRPDYYPRLVGADPRRGAAVSLVYRKRIAAPRFCSGGQLDVTGHWSEIIGTSCGGGSKGYWCLEASRMRDEEKFRVRVNAKKHVQRWDKVNWKQIFAEDNRGNLVQRWRMYVDRIEG